jgi:hypothetical protein
MITEAQGRLFALVTSSSSVVYGSRSLQAVMVLILFGIGYSYFTHLRKQPPAEEPPTP